MATTRTPRDTALAARALPLIFFGVSAALFWEAWKLPTQGQFGPGAGLFPSFVGAVSLLLAALLTLFPTLMGTGDAADDGPMAAPERRTFACYVAATVLLAASVYTGFLGASVLISLVVTWIGEGRRLRSALVFGIGFGLVTVLGLGGLLQVDIPASSLDAALMRLVR